MSTSPLSVPEAIERRRSVRKYTDAPVSDADLRRIVELAGKAPSAWNIQPWRVIAVRDPEVKAKLQKAAYGQAQVVNAPVVLAVYSDMQGALSTLEDTVHPGMPAEQAAGLLATVRGIFGAQPDVTRESWGNGQSYIAFGFLLLAAQSLGYSTSSMLGFDPAAVKAILGIPEHAVVPGLIALGVAAEDGFPHHRHPVDAILKIV
jgi:nitroreductase